MFDLTQSFDPQCFPHLGQYHLVDTATATRQALQIKALRHLGDYHCPFQANSFATAIDHGTHARRTQVNVQKNT